jgi:uncharacterized membrane protein YfcA
VTAVLRDKPLYLYLLVGLIGGLSSGLAGIGGGVIMVPLMVGILAMTQHRAQGTSLVIIIPTAIVSGAIYLFFGRVDDHGSPGVDPLLLIPLYAIPAMIGAPLGARLTKRLNGAQLRRLFGILIAGVALRLIVPRPFGDILVAAALVVLVAVLIIDLRRGSGEHAAR